MDAFNLITMTLPGIAVTYQGEEIGMVNTDISYEDTVDPSGCNCGPGKYQFQFCFLSKCYYLKDAIYFKFVEIHLRYIL